LLRGISWVTWFVAFVTAWVLFAALYWVVPSPNGHAATIAQGFQVGVGRGFWQGLYYWLQQQQVARGGQPWYYYLLLIPLYEQVAVVFGLAGLVWALVRPTRFRLFLVYWFLASLVLYSWAGEKMPWLSLHILLPLELLAAIALAALLTQGVALWQRARSGALWQAIDLPEPNLILVGARARAAGVVLGLLAALTLLVPTVYGMGYLAYKDAANGPDEMMVYVQTTPDVDLIMNKLNHADQLMYGGRHQLTIAIGQGEEWPFYWYLRDYWLDPHPGSYVAWDAPLNAPSTAQEDVLILTPGDADTFLQQHPTGYTSHTYHLRSWWDEGYKPAPCFPTSKSPCPPSSTWGSGVGVGPWLTYGDLVPPHGTFNLGKATERLWVWLWQRKPLGYDQGSYDFVLIVRNGVPIRP
jgi:predicted membrane-bound mannosyltransferase